ncbi:MAG: DUF1298 domain-containing protein [Actinobacteria bacterium]|nr:DUF1298 domain-containing protein [Actinomycetota bacterium]
MSNQARRMSDTEALMWRLEKDPYLASTFANITVLDRPLNSDALLARLERTSFVFPRLRRKVQPVPGNFGAPLWVDDTSFDIRYHVRHISLPEPGTLRQLLDLATLTVADPFDRSRPLWQFFIVDGLIGGRGALIQKLHHTVTDGQGGVELSLNFIDLERNPAPPPPLDPDLIARVEEESRQTPQVEMLRGAMSDSLRIPLGMLRQVRDVISDPKLLGSLGPETLQTVRSVMNEVTTIDPARSPLWTERSLRRQVEVIRAPYKQLRAASKHLGGTLNTAFITVAATAASEYHRALGTPIEELRTSMAISTRTNDTGEGGNAFSLIRFLVPTGEMSIDERFSAINEIVQASRTNSGSDALASASSVASLLPTSVITRFARVQGETVDFATSNVRAAGIPLYIAGALVLENYPLGPLAGTAFNLTLLSYNGSMDMGLNMDAAAIAEPALLRDELVKAFTQIVKRDPTPAETVPSAPALSEPATSEKNQTTKKRWWRRSR